MKKLFSALVLVFLASCTHHVRVEFGSVPRAEKHSMWVNGWLWHLVGGTTSGEVCGARPVAAIDTKNSLGNAFVGWLTLGIYTPMHVTITCGQPMTAPPQYAPPAQYAPPPQYPPPTQ